VSFKNKRENFMKTGNLNLARKWRSKNFDQIIGQELSVKILKNSLYLDHFFPVYLFSGQRGCGKTTTARVFAAAINCLQLNDFRQNPKKQLLPCNICASCSAMLTGKHPDFIEMDAASHTGVENVRNIADAASLLPVMGRKKIYLIDEAHMLSKSAFNAFLKILEEPPASVLFILATTDADKIIDTVKSRCFQLFFGPVKNQPLLNHLNAICVDEVINADDDALSLIIKETDGSVRDAINVLERIRFSASAITKEAVRAVLGHLDDEQIIQLLEAVLRKTPADLIAYFKDVNLESVAAPFVWRRLIDLIRASIWLKNGVQSKFFSEHALRIKNSIKDCTWVQLNHMLSQFYANEEIFKRTTAQYSFLEMMLLDFCQKYSNNDSSDNNSSSTPTQATSVVFNQEDVENDSDEDEFENGDQEDEQDDDQEEGAWPSFIQEVSQINDPLLISIFKQAQLLENEHTIETLKVAFSKELKFFSDWLDDTEHLWRPLLEKHFGVNIKLDALFVLEKKVADAKKMNTISLATPVKQPPVEVKEPVQKKWQPNIRKKQHYQPKQSLGRKVSGDDLSKLVYASMMLRHFPGDVYELQES